MKPIASTPRSHGAFRVITIFSAAIFAAALWFGFERHPSQREETPPPTPAAPQNASTMLAANDAPAVPANPLPADRAESLTQPPSATAMPGPVQARARQDAAFKALPQPDKSSLQQALFDARHAVEPITAEEAAMEQNRGARYFASNPGQQITARFRDDGVRLQSGRDGEWEATLRYVGSGGAATTPVPSAPAADGNRVEYRHTDGVTEWYENGRDGIEHGFILAQRPPSATAGEVRLDMAIDGLRAQVSKRDAGRLELVTPEGAAVLAYGKLKVVDAGGREVPARMEPAAQGLAILVADVGAVYPLTVDPLITSQEAKLTAGDAAGGALFGWSVAVDGNTALVGAPQESTPYGYIAGSAYVFVRNGSSWTRQAKLNATDGAAYDEAGWSVALSGDTALIGAEQRFGGPGTAYVFVRSGTTWTEQAKLLASDGASPDQFGFAVSLSGNTALVGAAYADTAGGTDAGAAYVFVRSGTTWSQQTKLVAVDGATSDLFGYAVSLSGNTALVGAVLDDTAVLTDSGSAYVFLRTGTTWAQQAKLTASDPGGNDQFGCAVALSGDTALIGAFFDDTDTGVDAGSAYVFVRSGTTWSQQAKLAPSDQAPGDWFGAAVALSGNTAVVKSQLDATDSGAETGSAYVFVRSGTTWTQQAKLVAGDAARTDFLPASVAISADTVLVGSYQDDTPSETDSGGASVFVRSGATWSLQAKLNGSDGTYSDYLGYSVALNGNTALIGAPLDDTALGGNAGSVYVLVRTGNIWSLQAKLIAADGVGGDEFGYAVALSGDTALIGAVYDSTPHRYQVGSAYVFVRNGTAWTQQAKLTADDGGSYDYFGQSVALDGNTALVGAYYDDTAAAIDAGSAYVFVRSGSTWSQQAHLTAADGAASDYFGTSVAISGDTALIGAYADDLAAFGDAGSAYVFVRSGVSWSQQAKLSASDKASSDYFGISVAISGDTALVGAYGDDNAAGGDAGGAYVFTRSGSTWSEQAKLTASDGASSDQFGYSVALDGNIALVGAYLADTPAGGDAGSAYLFTRTGTTWSQQAKLMASDGAASDHFGGAVAFNGNTALVGANLADTIAGTDAGGAYVFQLKSRLDFNADGKPDYVLFKPTTRETAIWYLNGATFVSAATGPTMPSGWAVVAVGDFNGDGKPDYALFNAGTRQTYLWYLNGATTLGGAYGPTLPSGWALVGVGDFNADGKPDLVLSYAATRQTYFYYLNGPTLIGGAYGPTITSGYSIVGVGDFNGDDKPDLALFNAGTLQTFLWYLNGATTLGGAYGPSLPSGWSVAGTEDFNRDGKPDYVLVKTSTAQTAIWYMNGPTYLSGATGPTLPTGWSLIAR